MPKPAKISQVAEIKEKLESNEIAIITQYQGISVAKVTDLRKKLRDQGIEYKVYKNTLATIALKEFGVEEAASFMNGPTAWVFSNDPVAPAKILKEYAKESKTVTMSGGILNGLPISAEKLETLASLPSREQLLAQVVGTIAMPLRNTLGVLTAVPRNLVNVVDQIKKKKEEEGSAAA